MAPHIYLSLIIMRSQNRNTRSTAISKLVATVNLVVIPCEYRNWLDRKHLQLLVIYYQRTRKGSGCPSARSPSRISYRGIWNLLFYTAVYTNCYLYVRHISPSSYFFVVVFHGYVLLNMTKQHFAQHSRCCIVFSLLKID